MAEFESVTFNADLLIAGHGEGLAIDRSSTIPASTIVLPRVYEELRSLAAAYLQRERADHTLQPTALVHETYLKLKNTQDCPWKSEAEFIAIAASVMRKVLIDHARRHGAIKRGGGEAAGNRFSLEHVADDEARLSSNAPSIDLLELDDSLRRLETLFPRQARLVELRYFGGLSLETIAELLGISLRTAAYDWRMARAWLLNQLAG